MAVALVARSPIDLDGRLVLDVGTGTGLAAAAVAAKGGRVVAVDLALDMLRHDPAGRPPAAQADASRLPFARGRVDAVVSAFCVNHAPGPRAMLGEAARVTRAGGAVVASIFDPTVEDPLKVTVDALVVALGWTPPPWYLAIKESIEPDLASVARCAEEAEAAGLVDVAVHAVAVDLGPVTAADVVAYRLGATHLAPFVAALAPDARARLTDEAARVVAAHMPWRPAVWMIVGRVPRRPPGDVAFPRQ
jgi:ubiquinone/menaquinone biosynthesis C-methylase UbiE